MARSKHIYSIAMKLWPLSKVAYRLGHNPLTGPLVDSIFNPDHHAAVMIPVNEAIPAAQSAVLPYGLLDPIVLGASSRFIMSECMCRSNEGCQHFPHEIGCLFLGDGAAQINPELGRSVSQAEALDHIRKAMSRNLTPLIAHTAFDSYVLGIPYRRMLTICFCCDCCCAVRKGLRLGPQSFLDVVRRLPGLSIDVNEECVACEQCVDECLVHAISIQDGKAMIGSQCKGCGHCAEICPVDAISVHLSAGTDTAYLLMDHLRTRTDIGTESSIPSTQAAA